MSYRWEHLSEYTWGILKTLCDDSYVKSKYLIISYKKNELSENRNKFSNITNWLFSHRTE